MQCMKRENNTPTGFTLIELLVVTVSLAVISLAIYATFASGIKIWQRLNKANVVEEDLDIFFVKFTADLKNSCRFKSLPFLGEKNRMEFTTLVNSQRIDNKKSVGKVIYFYDTASKSIKKQGLDFSHIYEGEEGIVQNMLDDVNALRFQYYFYDKEKKEYLWQDEWRKDGMPLAARMELEFGQDNFVKTVNIPIGG